MSLTKTELSANEAEKVSVESLSWCLETSYGKLKKGYSLKKQNNPPPPPPKKKTKQTKKQAADLLSFTIFVPSKQSECEVTPEK